jgi:septal ring factor EnvC (AmiA/AmiB activator)
MKISKTALLVLGIGIFIIVFATLFTMYSRQSGDREQLNDNLAKAQALLPQLVGQRQDLEGQLTQSHEKLAKATSSLTTSEARFPKSVESIEYDETLFKIADDCDLQVVELTASEPKNE